MAVLATEEDGPILIGHFRTQGRAIEACEDNDASVTAWIDTPDPNIIHGQLEDDDAYFVISKCAVE